MKKSLLVKFAVCLLIFIAVGFADPIDIKITTNGGAVATFKNNTNSSWRLGGFRYETMGGQWSGVDAWMMADMLQGHNPEELYYKSTAPSDNAAGLKAGTTATWTHRWEGGKDWASLAPKDNNKIELLLKTGAAGIPEEPKEYDPITIDSLKKLITEKDFYNPNYRYFSYDSLGSNGGLYSGGFINTYIGQTQIHFAIPKGLFSSKVSNTNISAMRGENAPEYYMALAMGREYFRVDAQYMFSIGVKETFSGTNVTPWATNGDQAGNYTNWHVEGATMGDRAMNYPHFFPKYEAKLSAARDLGSSGLTGYDIADYYVGMYNGQNSPRIINGLLASVLVWYTNYDLLAYSANYCMKNAFANAKDPYLGIAAMIPIYNLGNTYLKTIGDLLNNPAVYNDPLGRNSFPIGNNNYRIDVLTIAQDLVNASRDFEQLGGNNSEIIDFKITLDQLRAMFFGTGGTPTKSGDGGLLLHYYDLNDGLGNNYTATRQKIWDNLTEAFNLLKGNAPTADANTISYRYDFLTALRIVKENFPFVRNYKQNGDAATLIPANSKNPCTAEGLASVDEKYPFITNVQINPDETLCELVIDMEDKSGECKQVKWSVDPNWANVNWHTAKMNESKTAEKNTFTINVSADMASNGDPIWIMAEDAAGNSVVRKEFLSFKTIPSIKWAAIYDTTGDGYPDIIKAEIKNYDYEAGNDPVFSWGTITEKRIPKKNITKNGNIFTFDIREFNSINGAATNGLLTIDYLEFSECCAYMVDVSKEIIDSCGPAIKKGGADFYPSNGQSGQYDTLTLEFTEDISILGQQDYIQLLFSIDESGTNPLPVTTAKIEGKWIFLYNSGQITKDGELAYFWVKIQPGGAAVCEAIGPMCPGAINDNSPAKNPALDINQWVKINDHSKPSLTPNVISAVMLDRWGDQITNEITPLGRDYLPEYINRRADGIGDILVVKLEIANETGAYTTQEIDSVTFTWNNKTYGKKTIISNFNNTEFYIFDSTITGGSGTGSGKIFFTSGDSVVIDKIEDKIAPVIVSGNYERYDDRADTLRVKFSEEIKDAQIGIEATSGYKQFKLVSFSKDAAVYALENGNLVKGDSIWISPIVMTPKCITSDCPQNLLCEDLLGNKQTNDNQHIEISYAHFVSFNLKKATYFDTSVPADGYIDLITAEFELSSTEINVSEDEIKKIVEKFGFNESRKFNKIKPADIKISGNTIEIKVSQDKNNVLAKTDVDKNDVISVEYKTTIGEIGIFASTKNMPVDDNIAPIITSGKFSPMVIKSDEDEIIDTLRIWFSEKISGQITKDLIKALSFSNNMAEYEIAIEEQNAKNTDYLEFLVKFNGGNPLPEKDDSIRIQYGISDNIGNVQNENTVWAELKVEKYITDYNIMIYPNPYNPGNPNFDGYNYNPALENYYGSSKDMAIVIKPYGNRKLTRELSGQMVIFDHLGHKIATKDFEFINGALIGRWDGKNIQKRNVGSGAYQTIIQINDEEPKTILKRIGIKN